jgi:asparagine synthase (glutamine-hydrolysing)
MCGIAGLVPLGKQQHWPAGCAGALARSMANTMVHRGPDDSGEWESADGSVALAHRRLSIVDLSPGGRNPMARDNGRIWITFNGEIYNFLELRGELESAGHRFQSHTDTEVVLAAYDQWGVDCLQRFVGMFAFGLWDTPRRRLWLVRDRLGKKPLYYADYGGALRFASELKALLADPAFPRDVAPAAVRQYLRYGYVPSPCTIFSTARKLPPAHYLLCEDGHISVTRYWDPMSYVGARLNLTDQDAEAELESLLSNAVRQRRIADVPLGAFLSGGLDSSLIVALMQEQSPTPVRTFTVRFDAPEVNEADHAAAVAARLATTHVEQRCGIDEMLAVVDHLPDMFDEPFADSSAIPTHLLATFARQHVTVALSGDGGDELFLGYPRYRAHAAAGWALALPRPLRRAAARAADRLPTRRLRRIADVLRSDDVDRYARFITWWSNEDIIKLTGMPAGDGEMYAEVLANADAIGEEALPGVLDLVSYLPEDILTKVDRASMASSLEVRAPLLDHRVVEFALGLSLRLKRRGGSTKWLLRRLLDKRVPRELVERPKMGFGVPLGEWLRGPLRDRMNVYASGTDLEDLGIEPGPIRQLWTDFLAGRSHRADLLWQAYVLIGWSQVVRSRSSGSSRA